MDWEEGQLVTRVIVQLNYPLNMILTWRLLKNICQFFPLHNGQWILFELIISVMILIMIILKFVD
jgi:hypothetical protein